MEPLRGVAHTKRASARTSTPRLRSTSRLPTGSGYAAESGASVTFLPGCTIKYKNDAYMLLYGPITFPTMSSQGTGLMPVFTSRNDDNFGEVIQGVPGEAEGSNGDPTVHKAAQAIWIYYTDDSNTIGNARIRWAKIGIQNDRNAEQTAELTVRDCLFEHITGPGSAGISGDQTLLTPINLRKCNVTNPGAPMTDDCGPLYTVASFAGIKQQESGSYVPDTMGAVGPNHFMVLVNGPIAVYDKYSGVQRSPTTTTLSEFFALTVPSGTYAGTYPTVQAVDPRILYDQGSERWIASALDSSSGHVLLAVSRGSDPVGNGGSTWVSDNWIKYLVPFGPCYT